MFIFFAIIFLFSLFILHRNRLSFSANRHLIYAERIKDFKMAENDPLKDNRFGQF